MTYSILVGAEPNQKGTDCPRCARQMTFGVAGNWWCRPCTHENYVKSCAEEKMFGTLREVLPSEFSKDFTDVPAWKYADVEVSREHLVGQGGEQWPGPQKNVFFWVELVNGKAVGWNENPSKGWSFPVITIKKE